MIASDSSPKDLLTFEATQADSAFDAGFLDDAGTLEPKEVIHVDDTIPSTPTFSTEETLTDYVKLILECMPPDCQETLKAFFKESLDHPVKVGTLCSGSDAVLDCLQATWP